MLGKERSLMMSYQPTASYIITGSTNTGKTYLAHAILRGLVPGTSSSSNFSKYITHATLEDDRNTAHLTLDTTPGQSYLLVDKIHAHQLQYQDNLAQLKKLIDDNQPTFLIIDGQDPDGQLEKLLLNDLGLAKLKTKVIHLSNSDN